MGKVTIFVFTRHQKRLRLFAACFDTFWENLCCYIFSVPLYIPVFSSLFSILLFNLLTILRSFYFTVSVNIANTNFSRMTILDYVACFFTFSLFYIFPWYLACVDRRLRERGSACRPLIINSNSLSKLANQIIAEVCLLPVKCHTFSRACTFQFASAWRFNTGQLVKYGKWMRKTKQKLTKRSVSFVQL